MALNVRWRAKWCASDMLSTVAANPRARMHSGGCGKRGAAAVRNIRLHTHATCQRVVVAKAGARTPANCNDCWRMLRACQLWPDNRPACICSYQPKAHRGKRNMHA